jgi:hypothetical protein
VEAVLRVILGRQHIAHDHVDLAGLLIDDLHQIVHGLVLAAQQPAAHQIDGGNGGGDAKRLGQLASRASSVGRRKSAGMGITLTGVAWVTLKNCSCMEAIPCCHRRFLYYPVSYFVGNVDILEDRTFSATVAGHRPALCRLATQ